MKKAWILALTCSLILACQTKEPPESQVNDLQIMRQVKSKLASDAGFSGFTDVSVSAANGIVMISGQVDSLDTRARVEAIVKSVPKVVAVVNSIQISPKTR